MSQEHKAQKILVIDDDPILVELVQARLGANGYEVITATDAPAGLEIAMTGSPDLIILDVMMPIINGYNICRLMKSDTGHKDIPIILLTARTAEQDLEIGHEVGADAYLFKPLDTKALLKRVQELLCN